MTLNFRINRVTVLYFVARTILETERHEQMSKADVMISGRGKVRKGRAQIGQIR